VASFRGQGDLQLIAQAVPGEGTQGDPAAGQLVAVGGHLGLRRLNYDRGVRHVPATVGDLRPYRKAPAGLILDRYGEAMARPPCAALEARLVVA